MRDREQGAVQREAMQVVLAAGDAVVLPLAIAHVADQRAADVLEVPANRVETTGVKTSFDEGVPAAGGREARGLGDPHAAGVGMDEHEVAGQGGPRCWRKKSIWTCSRARLSLGSGTMWVGERVMTSARLPAT